MSFMDDHTFDMDQASMTTPAATSTSLDDPSAASGNQPIMYSQMESSQFVAPRFSQTTATADTRADLPAGPNISGKEQAIMWHQGHYMGGGESGFISASTTQPSSRTGHDDDHDTGCFTGPGSITGSSIYDLDSAQQSEVSSVHSSQAAFGLTDPEEFIPRLVSSLCDEDLVVVYESLNLVERCVKKKNFFNALIRSSDLVGAIVQTLISATGVIANAHNALMANNNNEGHANQGQQELFEAAQRRAKSASNILRAMTNHRDPGDQRESENQRIACQNILTTGGIPPLTGLLACRTDRIMFNAIATIHSLLLCLDQDELTREAAKHAVREANGVHMMVALLKRDNVKLLTIITDCLRILAMKNQPTKVVILQGNGPAMLVGILKQQSYKNLIIMTARLLKVLSVCPHNKQAIIQSGGMEALAKHLQSDQSKITYNCSWTMRNLSDVATHIEQPSHLAKELVALLRHREEPIVICAAGIISNLTVNNEPLKLAVCEMNGIGEMSRVLDLYGQNQELLEPAMCALRHLTNNHRMADVAQRVLIVDLQGLAKIARFLHPNVNRPCLKAVLGVVRNLAQKPVNHQSLREQHFVQYILSIFSAYMKNPNGMQPQDGVRWDEIVEACLCCIFHLSKDVHCRITIHAILPYLKQLLAHPSENMQRLVTGILSEIANDMDGAAAIQSAGLVDAVSVLSHSHNDKIASYANAIMYSVINLKKCRDERSHFRAPMAGHGQSATNAAQTNLTDLMANQNVRADDHFLMEDFPAPGQAFDSQAITMGQTGAFQSAEAGRLLPVPTGSPQGFMDDMAGADVDMEIGGIMSPAAYSQPDFNPGYF